MKTYAYTINLKNNPEAYKKYHRAVWPEIIECNRKLGIIRSKIFLLGTRVFMIIETEDSFDPVKDLQNYASGPREKEWDALMCTFQEPVPEAAEGEWWAQMELVFDLDDY
ncbi:MAG: L-rhamnose mutarotase [Ruminiclostridium sp.]|nr:L-rhamnose mutarotase [Ruminiclostridium sp.]